jgi:hypothetical protein
MVFPRTYCQAQVLADHLKKNRAFCEFSKLGLIPPTFGLKPPPAHA